MSKQTSPPFDLGPGRKVRTGDCSKCKIWGSLRQAGLPASSVQAICERMWLNRVRKGQTLYLEGNRATHLYALRRGTVKLIKVDAGGREHVTAILETGSLFGFEAAFDQAYTTGAEAHRESELCLVSAEELRELMREIPHFAVDLGRYVYRRLVDTRRRQAYLANPGARARLAGYLLSRLSSAAEGEAPRVPHELTQRELGGILGLSPETVCRTIGSFRREGVIEIRANEIYVREPTKLVQLAAH